MDDIVIRDSDLSLKLIELTDKISYDDFLDLSDFEKNPISEDEIAVLGSEAAQKTAYRLGQIGFIIPPQMIKQDIYSIMLIYLSFYSFDARYESLDDPESIISKMEYEEELCGRLFKMLYNEPESWYFNNLKERIMRNIEMDPLISCRVTQAFNAYHEQLYFPCACSLFALIEGELGSASLSSSTKLYELTNKIAKYDDVVSSIASENLKGFISELAKSAHFVKDPEPSRLNRHWLIHGRSKKEITHIDCVRLFCAFRIIVELIGKPNYDQ